MSGFGPGPAATSRARSSPLPSGRRTSRRIRSTGSDARTRQHQPELDEQELQEATDGADVDAREDVAEEPLEVRRRPSCSTNDRGTRQRGRRGRARCPTPAPSGGSPGVPPARGCQRVRAADRAVGSRSSPRGRGARRPRCRRRTGRSRRSRRGQRCPVELAREREVVGGPAEPGEVGEWGEARDGALVSIQEEPAESDRAGDASRRSTAEDGRQRERHRPAASARRPSQIAYPAAASTRNASPGSFAKAPPATRSKRRSRPSRSRATTCPNSFSSAIRRLVMGRPRRIRGSPGAPRRPACRTARGSTRG